MGLEPAHHPCVLDQHRCGLEPQKVRGFASGAARPQPLGCKPQDCHEDTACQAMPEVSDVVFPEIIILDGRGVKQSSASFMEKKPQQAFL